LSLDYNGFESHRPLGKRGLGGRALPEGKRRETSRKKKQRGIPASTLRIAKEKIREA